MGSRRDIIVLAGVLFTLIAIAFLSRPSDGAASDDPRPSTFLTGPNGAAALYMVLDELGIRAERHMEQWSADSSLDVLVVLAPSQAATPREMRALQSWIEGGGTLIYGAGGMIDALLGLHLDDTLPDTLGALATVRWSGKTAFPQPHPWTEHVDSIAGFMTVFDPASGAPADSTSQVLMRTADGDPAVVSFRYGAGRVIAFSDAGVLGNGALRDGDAALLFVRASTAVMRPDGVLRFDEYHHGYREASPLRALGAVLTGTGGGRALLQLGVACLALVVLAGARFGAPVREHAGRRRSPLEHMQALAGAYERSGARGTARRLLLAGMERQLGRRVFGDSRALPPAALEGSAAGRRLKQQWERGADVDLADLAGAVDEFVTEVRRWK